MHSRYYDPEWGRFLNADVFVSTGQGLLSSNMFTYCLNNPVMHCDPVGLFAVTLPIASKTQSLKDTAQGGGGAIIGPGPSAVDEVVEDIIEGIKTLVTSKTANEDQREYTVYFLYAAGGDPSQIVYVGRVKTANFNS